MFRNMFAALAAFSMAASPAVAQTAPPPSQIERAGAEPGESRIGDRGVMGSPWIVPALALIGVIAAAYLLLKGGEEDVPLSP